MKKTFKSQNKRKQRFQDVELLLQRIQEETPSPGVNFQ